jgi:hypothetical protein
MILEICDGIAVDTLTGETVAKSIYIKSGMRNIYLGINTLAKIIDFVKAQGGIIPELKKE